MSIHWAGFSWRVRMLFSQQYEELQMRAPNYSFPFSSKQFKVKSMTFRRRRWWKPK